VKSNNEMKIIINQCNMYNAIWRNNERKYVNVSMAINQYNNVINEIENINLAMKILMKSNYVNIKQ